MPRFLYSVVFIGLISTGFTIYVLFTKSPQEQYSIVFFSVGLFLTLLSWISLVMYFFGSKKAATEIEKKKLFRLSAKKAVIVSFYVICLLLLKYFQLLNILTFFLYTCLYIFGLYLRRKFF